MLRGAQCLHTVGVWKDDLKECRSGLLRALKEIAPRWATRVSKAIAKASGPLPAGHPTPIS